MQNRWNEKDAQAFEAYAEARGDPVALGLRVYSSRLIGQDPDLVLHGGGNTSVKIRASDGSTVIHVKGSGWDLSSIEASGLPGMHLAPLLTTRDIPHMSDEDMVAFLRTNLLDPDSPTPSVEALLHAYVPHAFVDHTHATAILALADQTDMEPVVKTLFDGRVGWVPYVMPGYDLSHACKDALARDPSVQGLWLAQHGLFTFGATARESYELMIEFVTLAEAHLAQHDIVVPAPETTDRAAPEKLAKDIAAALAVRGALGAEPALDFRSTPSIRAYLDREDLPELARRGTVTPDHVIRLKPFGMLLDSGAGRAEIDTMLDQFAANYCAYFKRNAPYASEKKIMLDPLPRIILVPGKGIFGVGASMKAACIAGDLFEQTCRVVNAAEAYQRFSPISERDLFDMEYWSLEQAKLRKTN